MKRVATMSGLVSFGMRSRVLPSVLMLLFCSLSMALTLAPARADIRYSYTTTLDVSSGPDTAQLDGATVNITFSVPSGSTYVELFNEPAVPVVNPVVTISGSGIAANNGTFPLAPATFFPAFAGLFTQADGLNFDVPLVGGVNTVVTLTIEAFTTPTPIGSIVTVGQTVDASHFGPTTSAPGTEFFGNDGTVYALVGTTVTVEGDTDSGSGNVSLQWIRPSPGRLLPWCTD